ncbi:MAG: hypothetical protein EOP38_19975 [Rubrivivax sp.]|nr:MAG: hypothetical protein EOP38_19975 [Rubrivivax sp.]
MADSRRGLRAGLVFAVAEAVQTIALLPLIREQAGAGPAGAWVVFGASSALVGLAGTAYFQPIVRSIVALQPVQDAGRLPANWSALQRSLAMRCALLLALLQGLFLLCVPGREGHLDALSLPVLLTLFMAQHLRLVAMGQFTAYNGMAWLGEDKLQMARASLLGLMGSVAVLSLGGGLLGLALVQVASQGWLTLTAWRGLRSAPAGTAPAMLAPGGQALALLCLGLAGYLNVGTDALLAGAWLSASALVDYGVLSRTLALAPAAVALGVHVRFPAWSAPSVQPGQLNRDLALALMMLGLALPAMTALFMVWHRYGPLSDGLPATLIVLAGLNAFVASAVIVIGQMLLARSEHGFVWPSTLVAACAPALAGLAALKEWPGSFMLGYLVCNGALLVMQLMWFGRANRGLGRA